MPFLFKQNQIKSKSVLVSPLFFTTQPSQARIQITFTSHSLQLFPFLNLDSLHLPPPLIISTPSSFLLFLHPHCHLSSLHFLILSYKYSYIHIFMPTGWRGLDFLEFLSSWDVVGGERLWYFTFWSLFFKIKSGEWLIPESWFWYWTVERNSERWGGGRPSIGARFEEDCLIGSGLFSCYFQSPGWFCL